MESTKAIKNSRTTTAKRQSQGRQKIEIKKIDDVGNRQVTFSKRRQGLFKKASELSVMTGAEVAVLVESIGGRFFAFGSPSADAVLDRYISNAENLEQQGTCSSTSMLQNKPYDMVRTELEAEKKRWAAIRGLEETGEKDLFWWDRPVDDLGVEELEEYIAWLEQLQEIVKMRAQPLKISSSPSTDVADATN